MTLHWETRVPNGVCSVAFDRSNAPMSKLSATCLKGRVHMWDLASGLKERYTEWNGTTESMYIYIFNLLNIEKRKSNGLPEVITIFARNFKMLIPFFFNQRIVLNSYCVPHVIFLKLRETD